MLFCLAAAHQSAQMGALPTLRAATDPTVRGGQCYGPAGFLGQHGLPAFDPIHRQVSRRAAGALTLRAVIAAPVVDGVGRVDRYQLPGEKTAPALVRDTDRCTCGP